MVKGLLKTIEIMALPVPPETLQQFFTNLILFSTICALFPFLLIIVAFLFGIVVTNLRVIFGLFCTGLILYTVLVLSFRWFGNTAVADNPALPAGQPRT